jgi:putative methionine-R-sulfoxide reductase with GAF domain
MGEPLPDAGHVTAGLTEMAALLLAVEDMNEALSHIARIAVAVIPDGPSCGITVIRNGQPVTEVYAGSVPAWVDNAQYERGDGPCLQALRTGSQVVVQDLAAEDRWQGWPSVALEAGAHGVYAHPLQVSGEVLGALNLYAHEPNMFAEEVQRIALQFAKPAELLLAGVVHRLSQDEVIRQLHAAMSSRSVIDQAMGVIMAQRHCGPEEALNALRRMSNDSNVKLRDLAANLIASLAAADRKR